MFDVQRPFDLEDRTLLFSKEIVQLIKSMPKNNINFRICDQLFRSVTSIGANLREANEKLSKKDFLLRMKISRKEIKESEYWLKLLLTANDVFLNQIGFAIKETAELRKIFSRIIEKSENPLRVEG
jgi:four helix bundle protein